MIFEKIYSFFIVATFPADSLAWKESFILQAHLEQLISHSCLKLHRRQITYNYSFQLHTGITNYTNMNLGF